MQPVHVNREAELEFTVLMPCLNEALTVQTCVRKAIAYLKKRGISGEVLVADNGSTDGSQALAQAAGAQVVAISNKGYGAALIGGIAAARGRFVIMGDADDSYDFTNLDAFVDALRSGLDLVVGNRFRGGIRPGAMPLLNRYIGNPALSLIGRWLFASPVGDLFADCVGSSGGRFSPWDFAPRAWNSRAKWWSRRLWPNFASARCRRLSVRTVEKIRI